MSAANEKQIGGNHYKNGGEELWDRIERLGLNYFQGSAIKYIERCYRKGNTVQDLLKAVHYLEKLIEIETAKTIYGLKGHDACGRQLESLSEEKEVWLKETIAKELREAQEASVLGSADPFYRGPNLIDTRNFRQQSNVIDPKRD